MDLSIVIVGYNSAACLPRCIESIRSHVGVIRHEIIVVDNASTDGSPEMLARSFPGVRCVANAANRGFSKACNQGIDVSTGEMILLLNPDCEIHSGALASAVDYLRVHPDIGILGARLLNEDGRLQLACRRSIPTPRSAFFRLTGLSRLFPRNPTVAAYNLTYADETQTTDVQAVSGAFLMIPRRLVEEIGRLDERFFMFAEDLDWCLRVTASGRRVVYWPAIVVMHSKGQSIRSRRYASLFHFYHTMWLFYEKHYAARSAGWQNAAVCVGICTAGSARLLWNLLRAPFTPERKQRLVESTDD